MTTPSDKGLENQLLIVLADYSNDLMTLKKRNGKLPAQAAVERILVLDIGWSNKELRCGARRSIKDLMLEIIGKDLSVEGLGPPDLEIAIDQNALRHLQRKQVDKLFVLDTALTKH